jgi:hypothetical protein
VTHHDVRCAVAKLCRGMLTCAGHEVRAVVSSCSCVAGSELEGRYLLPFFLLALLGNIDGGSSIYCRVSLGNLFRLIAGSIQGVRIC